MSLAYVSLFSGIEAASVAWVPLGWEPLAFAEIEPFPSKVLAERFPDVPNLGDVAKVDWSPYADEADVVVGGSPCQAFSVAGRRAGLDDPRGRLMLEFVRAIRDIRPWWLVWENVPGVLSQDGGRAFATFLREIQKLRYGLAWRVLDAQFYGVAQRRRRVYVVGSLGSLRACSILFEPGCLPGGSAASSAKRQALTGACRTRAGRRGRGPAMAFMQNHRNEVRLVGGDGQIVGALCANAGAKQQNYVVDGPVARRLTPLECERLQGFPDNWTAVDGARDAPRYRAIGNSMAVPVMRWIGERIEEVERMGGNE